MKIFDWIHQQQTAVKSPLFAVSLVAVRQSDTPLMLLLHWHGFFRATPLTLPGIKPAMHSLPGTAIQINERWQRLEEVDGAVLEAAWQLGAWDLSRTIRRPCNALAATELEAHDCRRAFGDYEQADLKQQDHLLDDGAPDRAELLAIAARRGYTRWLFRPVAGGIWGQDADDLTLLSDGTRRLPCPVPPTACDPSPRVLRRPQGSRTTYRLGRGSRIIRCARPG